MGRRGRSLVCRGCPSVLPARPNFSLARSSFQVTSVLCAMRRKPKATARSRGNRNRAMAAPSAKSPQVVDDHHIGEREDQTEKQCYQADRQDQRQGDLKEVPPEAGAIHRRGIVNVLGYRAVTCEQDNGGER